MRKTAHCRLCAVGKSHIFEEILPFFLSLVIILFIKVQLARATRENV